MSSNDQKIFIQEGSNLDYCNCDEIEEKKVFSNVKSEYNLHIQNILSDDENNICTCGQRTTIIQMIQEIITIKVIYKILKI